MLNPESKISHVLALLDSIQQDLTQHSKNKVFLADKLEVQATRKTLINCRMELLKISFQLEEAQTKICPDCEQTIPFLLDTRCPCCGEGL